MNYSSNDTFTNIKDCYSDIKNYGSNGRKQPIINPTPSTILPKVYYCANQNNIQSFNFYGSCFRNENC